MTFAEPRHVPPGVRNGRPDRGPDRPPARRRSPPARAAAALSSTLSSSTPRCASQACRSGGDGRVARRRANSVAVGHGRDDAGADSGSGAVTAGAAASTIGSRRSGPHRLHVGEHRNPLTTRLLQPMRRLPEHSIVPGVAEAVETTTELPVFERFTVPPLRRSLGVHARRGARALRRQHLRAVQPLARSRRRWLARPADGLRRSDGARDRHLAPGRHDRAYRRSRRRRVSPALPARSRRRLAGADHRRAPGAALRRTRGVLARRDEARVPANARTPTDMEVWIRDLETGETRPVFGEGMYSVPADWSPDGTKLLAVDFRNNSDTSIHLVDLETGEAPEITPHDEDGVFAPGPWAADGSGFYLDADEGDGVSRPRVLRPRSESLRVGGDFRGGRRGGGRLGGRSRTRLARQRGRLGGCACVTSSPGETCPRPSFRPARGRI